MFKELKQKKSFLDSSLYSIFSSIDGNLKLTRLGWFNQPITNKWLSPLVNECLPPLLYADHVCDKDNCVLLENLMLPLSHLLLVLYLFVFFFSFCLLFTDCHHCSSLPITNLPATIDKLLQQEFQVLQRVLTN